MDNTLFEIKDSCRNNLTKFMLEAFLSIPKHEHPSILDMGCGTGVSALALVGQCNADVWAVDADASCITYLNSKARVAGYDNRIHTVIASALDPGLFQIEFDIVIAEGLLNNIGFDAGIPVLLGYLKPGGYLLIHEAVFNDEQNDTVYRQHGLKLIYFSQLTASVWKTEYFDCLVKAINRQNPADRAVLLKECTEIDWFKRNPMGSAFYVLQKI